MKINRDYRVLNVLAVMLLLIFHGTIGTSLVLLPLIIYTVITVKNALKETSQREKNIL